MLCVRVLVCLIVWLFRMLHHCTCLFITANRRFHPSLCALPVLSPSPVPLPRSSASPAPAQDRDRLLLPATSS